jgi:chromosome segregation ATPase
MDRSMLDAPLREEILVLRKKVVTLETAKSDYDRVKKELTKIKVTMHEEKSQIELDFMNQLSAVTRENSLKMEEISVRLQESNNVNRALSDQLQTGPTSAKEIEKRFQDIESSHEEEVSRLMNESTRNSIELGRMKREVNDMHKSRDELASKLKKSVEKLEVSKQSVRLNLELKELRSQSNSTLELEKRKKLLEDELKVTADGRSEMELNISRLEKENKSLKESLLSNSESKVESEKNHSTILKELEVSTTSQKGKDTAIVRLEDENRQLKDHVESLKEENHEMQDIVENIDRGEKISGCDSNSMEKETIISQLENEIQALKSSSERIEKENMELKNSLRNESSHSREFGSSQSNLYSQGQQNISPTNSEVSTENRTLRIIQQFERNLKPEGQMKQNSAVSIKTRTTNGRTSDIKLHALKVQVNSLNEQLENERENAYKLRKAIHEFTISTRVDQRGDETDPEPAVMSIVVSIENRMKKQRVDEDSVSIQRLMGHVDDFPDLAEVLEEIKDELTFHREQVFELEDELANQCEINCTLLKEISNFSCENEASCISVLSSPNYGDDQKEIDKLMMEVANIKSQLFNSDQARSKLQEEIDNSTQNKDSEENVHYKAQLESTQKTVHSITLLMDESKSLHKEEIDEFGAKIDKLQSEIDKKEETSRVLEEKNATLENQQEEYCISLKTEYESSQMELCKSQISELEAELSTTKDRLADCELKFKRTEEASKMLEERNTVIENQKEEYCLSLKKEYESSQNDSKKAMEQYKSKISELEIELSTTKDLLTDFKLKSFLHVEELNSKLESLKDKLLNSEESKAALAVEKEQLMAEVNRTAEKKIVLEEEAKQQHEQLEMLQKTVDEKLAEVEKAHEGDESQINRLQDQIRSLEQELTSTRELLGQLNESLVEKHEMEFTVEELSRKNTQSLHAQINKLQKEMTEKQMELAEVETRYKMETTDLKEIINSLNVEMDEILKATDLKVEKLKKIFEEKEGTNQRLEKEKEQLVLSMNDMMKTRRDDVDDIQNELMGTGTRLANQTREISTLKSRLEESQYQTQAMDRLKQRVTELSHELDSKKEAEEEFDNETLEIENNELREKLQDVTAELWAAEAKLQQYVSDRGGSSRSVQVLRERNASLKLEVEKLTRKLKKMSEKLSDNSRDDGTKPHPMGNKEVTSTRFAI